MWVQVGKEAGQPPASGYPTLETGEQDHVGFSNKRRLGGLIVSGILLLLHEYKITWVQERKGSEATCNLMTSSSNNCRIG
jgi:hypothetical protein